MNRNSVVVMTEREAGLASLVERIEAVARLDVVDHTLEPGDLAALVRRRAPSLLLVQLEEKGDLLLDAVEALPRPRPALVVLGPEHEGRLILRAMRLGARDYLPIDAREEQVRAALERAASPPAAERTEARAMLVAVMGAKGGTGATLVATQLALRLAGLGARTALVDLDLRHGDVGLYLDVHPPYGIGDVARHDGAVDASFLENVLCSHASGLRVLAAPANPEDAELIGAAELTHVLRLLGESHDWVVLDMPREFDEVALAALDLADEILLVAEPNIPTLHHTRRILALLERLGRPLDHVRLIANRCGKHSPVGERDLHDFLGRPSDVRLPNDFAAACESVNYGRPLVEVAPHSGLHASVIQLADQLHDWCGREQPERPASAGFASARRLAARLRKKLHGAD